MMCLLNCHISNERKKDLTHSHGFSLLLVRKKSTMIHKLARQLILMLNTPLMQLMRTNNVTEFVSKYTINSCDMHVF